MPLWTSTVAPLPEVTFFSRNCGGAFPVSLCHSLSYDPTNPLRSSPFRLLGSGLPFLRSGRGSCSAPSSFCPSCACSWACTPSLRSHVASMRGSFSVSLPMCRRSSFHRISFGAHWLQLRSPGTSSLRLRCRSASCCLASTSRNVPSWISARPGSNGCLLSQPSS